MNRTIRAPRHFFRLLTGTVLAGAALLAPLAAMADDNYPSKPIRIIVPYAPGGTGDVFARILAEPLGIALKQPVVIDNRPGASGAIGTNMVIQSPADGYTLLLGQAGEIAITPFAMKSVTYRPTRDLIPVTLIGDVPLVLAAPSSAPFNDVKQLIAAAKVKPNAIAYASSGTATPGHLAAAALALGTQTSMVHAPYKGAGQAMTDLLGAHVDIFFSGAPAAIPYLKTGRLKALAVSTSSRAPFLPDVPTIDEAGGQKNFNFSLWGGIFAPAGTPPAVVARLSKEFSELIARPEIKARLESEGAVVRPNTPAEFTAFVATETEKYQRIIKELNISLD
jgi:tripartite-type tricarboxylate transporter receptor subunit TctC